MGTVLTNPFELNFGGLAARNAENIKEAETTSGLLSSETRTTSCNSIYPNLQVVQVMGTEIAELVMK